MNVHHLELFYHVARCEGIVSASRQMPYSVQQPAISAQVARLEIDLGVRLFERRPFRLTPAGKILYEFITPFFGRLDEMQDLLQGKMTRVVRLAGLTEVLRDHVPVVLSQLRGKFPGLKVTLHEIDQHGAERMIAQGEADLAITVLEAKLPPGFHSETFARLPLCLVVRADNPYRRATDLLKAGAAGKIPLISLPPHEMLPRIFQRELNRRRLSWRTEMETSSQDLVSVYVRNGHGAGLAVRTPDILRDSHLRILPLKGFPDLPVGAFWRGKLAEIPALLVEALAQRSKKIFAGQETR